jgi:hypothetical protein
LILVCPALLSSSVTGANVIFDGPGQENLTIGNAVDADGNKLDASGSSFQVADDYEGNVLANLNGAIVSGEKVDGDTPALGGGTISDNAPSDSGPFDFYINTGAGDDAVEGSSGSDFVRLGAGDDEFNLGLGDDVVRLGTGDDEGTLGAGNDVIYLTVDQLQSEPGDVNDKVITDFDTNGDDKIQIDEDLEGLVEITGVGTNTITITLSGEQSGVTTITSQGESIDEDDIEFI